MNYFWRRLGGGANPNSGWFGWSVLLIPAVVVLVYLWFKGGSGFWAEFGVRVLEVFGIAVVVLVWFIWAALKMEPTPEPARRNFLAIAIALFGVAALGFGRLLPHDEDASKGASSPEDEIVPAPAAELRRSWPKDYTPVRVVDKYFHNEQVVLDGHDYLNCRFENVKLVYNGTTPLLLNGSEFISSVSLDSESAAVRATVAWLYAMRMIKSDLGIRFDFPLGSVEQMQPKGTQQDLL